MGQLAFQVAGAVVGGMFGMPQLGWAIGGIVGGLLADKPDQKQQELMDLKITGSEYGQAIPFLIGYQVMAGQVWWNSDRIPRTTTSGGKGGEPEVTTTVYDMNVLYGLTNNKIAGISKVFDGGKLIWSMDSEADEETIKNSLNQDTWDRLTVYTGDENQLPDPTYELEFDEGNAPAYRGRGSVFIENLKLGQSGSLRNLTFEVCTRTEELTAREMGVVGVRTAASDLSNMILQKLGHYPARFTVNQPICFNHTTGMLWAGNNDWSGYSDPQPGDPTNKSYETIKVFHVIDSSNLSDTGEFIMQPPYAPYHEPLWGLIDYTDTDVSGFVYDPVGDGTEGPMIWYLYGNWNESNYIIGWNATTGEWVRDLGPLGVPGGYSDGFSAFRMHIDAEGVLWVNAWGPGDAVDPINSADNYFVSVDKITGAFIKAFRLQMSPTFGGPTGTGYPTDFVAPYEVALPPGNFAYATATFFITPYPGWTNEYLIEIDKTTGDVRPVFAEPYEFHGFYNNKVMFDPSRGELGTLWYQVGGYHLAQYDIAEETATLHYDVRDEATSDGWFIGYADGDGYCQIDPYRDCIWAGGWNDIDELDCLIAYQLSDGAEVGRINFSPDESWDIGAKVEVTQDGVYGTTHDALDDTYFAIFKIGFVERVSKECPTAEEAVIMLMDRAKIPSSRYDVSALSGVTRSRRPLPPVSSTASAPALSNMILQKVTKFPERYVVTNPIVFNEVTGMIWAGTEDFIGQYHPDEPLELKYESIKVFHVVEASNLRDTGEFITQPPYSPTEPELGLIDWTSFGATKGFIYDPVGDGIHDGPMIWYTMSEDSGSLDDDTYIVGWSATTGEWVCNLQLGAPGGYPGGFSNFRMYIDGENALWVMAWGPGTSVGVSHDNYLVCVDKITGAFTKAFSLSMSYPSIGGPDGDGYPDSTGLIEAYEAVCPPGNFIYCNAIFNFITGPLTGWTNEYLVEINKTTGFCRPIFAEPEPYDGYWNNEPQFDPSRGAKGSIWWQMGDWDLVEFDIDTETATIHYDVPNPITADDWWIGYVDGDGYWAIDTYRDCVWVAHWNDFDELYILVAYDLSTCTEVGRITFDVDLNGVGDKIVVTKDAVYGTVWDDRSGDTWLALFKVAFVEKVSKECPTVQEAVTILLDRAKMPSDRYDVSALSAMSRRPLPPVSSTEMEARTPGVSNMILQKIMHIPERWAMTQPIEFNPITGAIWAGSEDWIGSYPGYIGWDGHTYWDSTRVFHVIDASSMTDTGEFIMQPPVNPSIPLEGLIDETDSSAGFVYDPIGDGITDGPMMWYIISEYDGSVDKSCYIIGWSATTGEWVRNLGPLGVPGGYAGGMGFSADRMHIDAEGALWVSGYGPGDAVDLNSHDNYLVCVDKITGDFIKEYNLFMAGPTFGGPDGTGYPGITGGVSCWEMVCPPGDFIYTNGSLMTGDTNPYPHWTNEYIIEINKTTGECRAIWAEPYEFAHYYNNEPQFDPSRGALGTIWFQIGDYHMGQADIAAETGIVHYDVANGTTNQGWFGAYTNADGWWALDPYRDCAWIACWNDVDECFSIVAYQLSDCAEVGRVNFPYDDIGQIEAKIVVTEEGVYGTAYSERDDCYMALFKIAFIEKVSKDCPTVEEAVTIIMDRAKVPSNRYDVSALSGVTRDVCSMAITQISGTRTPLDLLMANYYLQMVVSDKLYVLPRGSHTGVTIPYEALGGSTEEGSETQPLPLKQLSDVEVPAQIALTYINLDNDCQSDVQLSDRLASSLSSTTLPVSVALGLTPSEAKGIASTMLLDMLAASLGTTISVTSEYARLQATDCVDVMGPDGSSYRMRITKSIDTFPVMTFEMVIDEPAVLVSQGITSVDYHTSTVVSGPKEVTMLLIDAPMVRESDNDAGFYLAVAGGSLTGDYPFNSPYKGAVVYVSVDNAEYVPRVEVEEGAIMGRSENSIGTWSPAGADLGLAPFRGRMFDSVNYLDVNVGNATLSSSTRQAILNNSMLNLWFLDGEYFQATEAILQSSNPNIYRLTGLLRGSRGTEHIAGGYSHGYYDPMVLAGGGGIRRLVQPLEEVGQERYYKALPPGTSLATITHQYFQNMAQGLRPFSPVNLRGYRSGAGDVTLTWQRRSRMPVRMIGPAGISVPLGEATEKYTVIIYTSQYYNIPKRTINGVTTNSYVYTAAMMAADGLSPPIYFAVAQVSEKVGEGRFSAGGIAN